METIKPNIIALLSVLLVIFSFSGCDLIDEVISECDEKENQIDPLEKRSFVLHCGVNWKDGTDAAGLPVKYEIKKQYCEGHFAGFTVVEYDGVVTDKFGQWWSYYIMTYDFKNKKDRVLIKFIIAYGGLDYEYDYVYRWEDVEGGNVNEWKYITLPINPDGTE